MGIPLFKHFPGAGVVGFAVDFGEGGVEEFGDGLEAVVDFPGGFERWGVADFFGEGPVLAEGVGGGAGFVGFGVGLEGLFACRTELGAALIFAGGLDRWSAVLRA